MRALSEHLVVRQQRGDGLQDTDTCHDTQYPRQGSEEGTLRQYLSDDGGRGSPYGAADTYLFRPLADGNEHDIAYAYRAGEEGA